MGTYEGEWCDYPASITYDLEFSGDSIGFFLIESLVINGANQNIEYFIDLTYSFDGSEKGVFILDNGNSVPFTYNKNDNTITLVFRLTINGGGGLGDTLGGEIVFHPRTQTSK